MPTDPQNLEQSPNPSPPPATPPVVPQGPAQPGQPPAAGPSGYKKKPLWFWIGVYLVIAAVVYGAVYWLFYR